MSKRRFDDPRRGYQGFSRLQDRIDGLERETLVGAVVFSLFIVLGIVLFVSVS